MKPGAVQDIEQFRDPLKRPDSRVFDRLLEHHTTPCFQTLLPSAALSLHAANLPQDEGRSWSSAQGRPHASHFTELG
jgi:hypothetical protein